MPTNRGLQLRRDDAQRKKGKNYLVGIGINEYKYCPILSNAVRDVQAFVKIMQEKFGFQEEYTRLLFNEDATKRYIFALFKRLAAEVKKEDTVVIYFAGHGDFVHHLEEGAWVPVEAAEGSDADYIENSQIIKRLNAIKSLHTFLISDACFSGTVFSTRQLKNPDARDTEPSRWGFTSGKKEIVSDGVGEHSPFAASMLEVLEATNDSLSILKFCEEVSVLAQQREPNQTPVCKPLDIKGQYLGQLILYPKASEESEWQAIDKTNIGALEAHHQKYPDTKYDIPKLIDALKEDEAWQQATKTQTVAAYQAYLDTYEAGRYREEAQQFLKEAAKKEEKERERLYLKEELLVWKKVFNKRKQEVSCRDYLDKYPQGRFVKDAQAFLDALAWKEVCEEIDHFLESRESSKYHNAALDLKTKFNYQKDITALKSNYEEARKQQQKELPLNHPFQRKAIEVPIIQTQKIDNFIFVEGGTYLFQGDHEVTVPSFYINPYQTTVGEFQEFLDKSGYKMNWNRPFFQKTDKHPAVNVNWYDAIHFCNWKSKEIGLKPFYTINDDKVTFNLPSKGYRLPSETEWEFAARGGNLSKGYEYAGSNEAEEVAWYNETTNKKGTREVGFLKPNELGIYDMSGNVWEWCNDNWNKDYKMLPVNGNAWVSENGEYRVLRGGSVYNSDGNCRVANRDYNNPTDRYGNYGFRVVRGD